MYIETEIFAGCLKVIFFYFLRLFALGWENISLDFPVGHHVDEPGAPLSRGHVLLLDHAVEQGVLEDE